MSTLQLTGKLVAPLQQLRLNWRPMFKRSLYLSVVGLFIFAASIWAAPVSFEGTVRDANGKPVNGAELHLIAKDPSIPARIAKTDAAGRYAFGTVRGGSYQMILFVNGSIKATINNATTQIGSPTQLNFDLKTTSVAKKAPKKGTHMVYIPAETGSNLGGRWVEVPDTAEASVPSANNVQTAGGDAVREIQSHGR
jgi:Carboxypeptidase regulatory-like domain